MLEAWAADVRDRVASRAAFSRPLRIVARDGRALVYNRMSGGYVVLHSDDPEALARVTGENVDVADAAPILDTLGPADPLVELVEGDPALGCRPAEHLGRPVAVGVGGPQTTRIGRHGLITHRPTLTAHDVRLVVFMWQCRTVCQESPVVRQGLLGHVAEGPGGVAGGSGGSGGLLQWRVRGKTNHSPANRQTTKMPMIAAGRPCTT